MAKKNEKVPVMLYLEAPLARALKKIAHNEDRSVSAQVRHFLRSAVRHWEGFN